MAVILTFQQADKILKQYGKDVLMNLDVLTERAEQKKKEDKLKAEIDRLRKQVIKLENRECLYVNTGIKPKEKYVSEVETLAKQSGLNKKEIEKVYSKYGMYAGARNYFLKLLGRPIPVPEYRCDDERKIILKEYARIRDNEGIKKANEYFLKADFDLRVKEGKIIGGMEYEC